MKTNIKPKRLLNPSNKKKVILPAKLQDYCSPKFSKKKSNPDGSKYVEHLLPNQRNDPYEISLNSTKPSGDSLQLRKCTSQNQLPFQKQQKKQQLYFGNMGSPFNLRKLPSKSTTSGSAPYFQKVKKLFAKQANDLMTGRQKERDISVESARTLSFQSQRYQYMAQQANLKKSGILDTASRRNRALSNRQILMKNRSRSRLNTYKIEDKNQQNKIDYQKEAVFYKNAYMESEKKVHNLQRQLKQSLRRQQIQKQLYQAQLKGLKNKLQCNQNKVSHLFSYPQQKQKLLESKIIVQYETQESILQGHKQSHPMFNNPLLRHAHLKNPLLDNSPLESSPLKNMSITRVEEKQIVPKQGDFNLEGYMEMESTDSFLQLESKMSV